MGVIISTLAALTKSIRKPRRDKKTSDEAEQQQRQSLPHQQQQDPGVRDAQPAVGSTGAAPTLTGGVAEAQRAVGIASAIPVAEGGIGTGSTARAGGLLSAVLQKKSSNIGTERFFHSTYPPAASNIPPTTTAGKSITRSKGDNTGKMASDEDYAAFLDKANQDPNEGVTKQSRSSGKIELKAVDEGVKVPSCLSKATEDVFYVSDADEPFVPVALKYGGKALPDEVTFAKLVSHPSPKEADVEILDVGNWDKQGQYKEVVEATREASKGSDVRVYRISRGGSRIEYWIVGLEAGILVGAKALAIES
ncbi:uncharacterized protein BP5553_03434 [Venustampulla echinocandica]|uniref:Uncharacterized protein n=1 Tax=Venustampulla echinocandica TaxID=2656787 RepID=A0A370TU98_9HELO|nr:uncharacterized protein BP5553_03434 [Venustampulla echinocandica]RDL39094.1 hypothetical protein BP5553_03434 [Venustampulla echinocandica]